MIAISTRQNVGTWLPHGSVLLGWARAASGSIAEGILWIDGGIKDYRAAIAIPAMPMFLTLRANALHLANRTPEALEAISEAEELVRRFGARVWCAELYRLRGVFLAALGADETEIEASLCEAIRIAIDQKSNSLERRAEAAYAEYRWQKVR